MKRRSKIRWIKIPNANAQQRRNFRRQFYFVRLRKQLEDYFMRKMSEQMYQNSAFGKTTLPKNNCTTSDSAVAAQSLLLDCEARLSKQAIEEFRVYYNVCPDAPPIKRIDCGS